MTRDSEAVSGPGWPSSPEGEDTEDVEGTPSASDASHMSWEDLENDRPGQLALPEFTARPVVAERAFLALVRSWNHEVDQEESLRRLSADWRRCELACVLVAHEYGPAFTAVARREISDTCERVHTLSPGSTGWIDLVSWHLCESSTRPEHFSESGGVRSLLRGLGHHSSSIREWMMDLAWMVRNRLPPDEAVPILLRNLADKLGGPFRGAGLAAAICADKNDFLRRARDFDPPERFSSQYSRRLESLEELGLLTAQASFWRLEVYCRRQIEQGVLAQRLVLPHQASEYDT